MLGKPPEPVTRRIVVILGPSGSGQPLLNLLQPLLDEDTEIDLQGIFVEEDELQQAAALPFVNEVCRLTLSVREIHSPQFARAVALRTRTARNAIEELARRMGIPHSFQNVRGSTVSLLRETARQADITVFEPRKLFVATSVSPTLKRDRFQRRIVVAIDDLATGAMALVAARLLAKGEMSRVSILLSAANPARQAALEKLIDDLLPTTPANVVFLSAPGVNHMIAAARAGNTAMLVLGTSEELLKSESLSLLLGQLRCPVFLVRRWDGTTDNKAKLR
jgi:hypothetical protein